MLSIYRMPEFHYLTKIQSQESDVVMPCRFNAETECLRAQVEEMTEMTTSGQAVVWKRDGKSHVSLKNS
jgi:hypothetical protein